MKSSPHENVWQMQEAKNQLSRVVEQALTKGAQTITRHGKPIARLVSEEEFSTLVQGKARPSFAEFLLSMPKIEPDGLIIERVKDAPRPVHLE